MTKITGFRNILSNLAIILLFILIAYAFLFPLVEGKKLKTPDITHFMGMSKELVDYRNKTGDEAIWTDSMFGGMPGYMISVLYKGNFAKEIHNIIPRFFPCASKIILYLIGFYILLLSLGVKRLLSTVGAVAFALSSYFIIILAAGHNSKAVAIGYLPLVIAGVLMVYKNKRIPGVLLFTLGLSLEILAGHPQITYYGLLMLAIYGIVELGFAIKEKALMPFIKSSLFLVAGAIIAVGMNFSRLYTIWEYSKETIRGPSELTSNSSNKTSGLDKDYVVQWSQGIDETLTLLVPNYMGGSTSTHPTIKGETYKLLKQNNIQRPRDVLKGIILYRGNKPATAGPYYFGALVVFLFVLGLFVVKGPMKWWLLFATVVSFFLSWGKNMMWLTSFLLDYLPMYNKFRAPEMILVIAAFTFPLVGILGLHQILSGKVEKKDFRKGFTWALLITGGLSLLLFVSPAIAGSFSSPFDRGMPDWLLPGILADRKELLKMDALRSFVIIAVGAGLLYLWHTGKIKNNVSLIVGLGILILFDLWGVDKRYLNSDNFELKRMAEHPFKKMPVDEAILKDKDISYRVLPLQNPWADARTSYFHKNVGGYHAAKLRRYNELIDHELTPEINQMIKSFQTVTNADSIFAPLSAINMMNTRYLIYDLNKAPIVNPKALGNAWFVNRFKLVNNADEEIAALKNFDASSEAIIDKRFAQFVEGKNFQKDETGFIKLTEYQPNYLKYHAKAASGQLTVFSEIYYDKGWNAFVDGKPTPIFRVNYVLRAIILPAGEHTIEFRFKPKSYYTGNKISLASSFLLLLILAGFGFVEIRKMKFEKTARK